jgi:hypothetical protein
VEHGVIHPESPYTPYDPFDWYFPDEKASHPPSIHYQFLEVNAHDEGEILRFCERFGVLGHCALPWFACAAEGIEKLSEMKDESEAMKYLKQVFHISRRPSPTTLCIPMTLEEFRLRQLGFRQTVDAISSLSDPQGGMVARTFLESRVTMSMMTICPRLEWDSQAESWKFAWSMTSLDAHFFLMLALDLMGPGKIIFCLRCHKARYATNPRMKFCSPRCQNAYKVHAFYVRKREAQKRKDKRFIGKRHPK